MLKAPKLFKDENGAGFLLVIFALFVMLGVGGLVVDMGIAYKTKGEMRKAANAAVLSGVQKISVNDASVTKVVHYILKAHNEEDSLTSLKIEANVEKNVAVNLKKEVSTNVLLFCHIVKNKVTVTLKKDVPLYFMRIFGVNSTPVEVTSSAVREPVTEMGKVIPLGVQLGTKLTVGTEYLLKGDMLSPGWFGFLLIDGNKNPHDLSDLINSGYDGQIKVNDVIGRVPGEKAAAGKDITARKALIIIYEVINSSKKDSIRVKGFAYCNIRTDGKKLFYGTFIKRADDSPMTGKIDDALLYKIRLME